MKELKHIRNRINRRHGDRYYNHREERPRKTSRFYRFIVVCMTLAVLALGTMTFIKTPLYNDLKTYTMQAVPSFTEMLSTTFLAKFIPFEKWFDSNDALPVTATPLYEPGSQPGYFISTNKEAVSLYDGLVVYIGDDNGVKWVVVHHDNALYATYGNLSDINVRIYDRILKHDVLGTYTNEALLEFLYQNEDISYDEAISLEDE